MKQNIILLSFTKKEQIQAFVAAKNRECFQCTDDEEDELKNQSNFLLHWKYFNVEIKKRFFCLHPLCIGLECWNNGASLFDSNRLKKNF